MTRTLELKGWPFFHKLLAALLATGLAAVLTTSWTYYCIASQAIRKEIQSNLLETLHGAVDYFNISYGAPLESDLEFVSTSPTLDAYLASQENDIFQTKPDLEFLFLREIKTTPLFYRSIRFLNRDGDETIVVNGTRRIHSYHSIKEANPDMLHRSIFTLFKRLSRTPSGTMLLEGPFQTGPDRAWTFFLGRMRPDPESNTRAGAVIFQADLTDFVKYLSHIQFRGYRVAWAHDPQGHIILPPMDEKAWRHQKNVFTFYDSIHLGSDHALLLKLIFQNSPMVFADALQSIFKMTLWVIGIIMLAVILVALAISRQFSRPLIELARATRRLAGGERSFQIPVAGGGELQLVAESFNQMISDLDKSTVSKDFMSKILDNLLDPLLVLASDTIIQVVNPAAEHLMGYKQEEIIGKSLRVLLPAGEPRIIDDAGNSLQKATLRNVELNLAAKDGAAIPVLFSSTVIRDDQNQVISIVVTAKDMTERKKLEQQLLQTGKLSAVGQLAGGVAHEINNPLGVILGFAQGMLRRVKLGDDFEMPLKSVEREAVRCKNLVQDLLTFSRTSKTDRELMDLNQAIEGALSLVMAQARLGQVKVQKYLTPNLPRMLGNPNQVQQVIINLANNALDAMGKTGTLTLRTEFLEQDLQSWVRLYVTDTGSGIPQDVLPRIFEPFFTTKPVGQGTGLGLGLVHEIVLKHSGTIEVQSQPGNTEFCVHFPVSLSQGNIASRQAA